MAIRTEGLWERYCARPRGGCVVTDGAVRRAASADFAVVLVHASGHRLSGGMVLVEPCIGDMPVFTPYVFGVVPGLCDRGCRHHLRNRLSELL